MQLLQIIIGGIWILCVQIHDDDVEWMEEVLILVLTRDSRMRGGKLGNFVVGDEKKRVARESFCRRRSWRLQKQTEKASDFIIEEGTHLNMTL